MPHQARSRRKGKHEKKKHTQYDSPSDTESLISTDNDSNTQQTMSKIISKNSLDTIVYKPTSSIYSSDLLVNNIILQKNQKNEDDNNNNNVPMVSYNSDGYFYNVKLHGKTHPRPFL